MFHVKRGCSRSLGVVLSAVALPHLHCHALLELRLTAEDGGVPGTTMSVLAQHSPVPAGACQHGPTTAALEERRLRSLIIRL